LADDRADIDVAGRSGEQRNQAREERSAARAANRPGDRVADRAEVDVLEPRTDGAATDRAS
jgi:hypothetical protein